MTRSHQSPSPSGVPAWEDRLDRAFEEMVSNPRCRIPGLVAIARRGDHRYHKAFGYSDLSTGKLMELDAQFRVFSMTKVLTATIALWLRDEGALNLDDPVSSYIPTFDRTWRVLCEASEPCGETGSVDYLSFLTGTNHTLDYSAFRSEKPMTLTHCLAECSGIGYDMWTDFDLLFGLGLGNRYGAAQGLRRAEGAAGYSSSSIIGQDLSLAEYCDAIARAGVLVDEPGSFSYGLGALVAGRVCEVAYARLRGHELGFADICDELLFRPLEMSPATFFLDDGDTRAECVPVLYGGVLRDSSDPSHGCDVRPIEQCLPGPVTVGTNHCSGARLCESGDTGALMTAADYGKFYDMILRDGRSESGERILSPESVRQLTHGTVEGVARQNALAAALQVNGSPESSGQTFNLGWASRPESSQHAHCNFWSGYANTHGRLYPDQDEYVAVFPQFMASTTGGFVHGSETVAGALVDAWEAR